MATLMRVSIIGAMPNGEVWSVNPVYRLGSGGDVPTTAAQVTTIVGAINALVIPTGVLTMFNSATTVTGCRVEARTVDGTLDALAEGSRAVPVVGTGSQSHPFQTSVVSSLRTTTPGPSGRGRLYWPATGVSIVNTSLRINSANITSHLSGVKSYLTAIDAAIEATMGGVTLGVWSRKTLEVHAVVQIQMGDVADVQRRRRDALIEAVQATTFP